MKKEEREFAATLSLGSWHCTFGSQTFCPWNFRCEPAGGASLLAGGKAGDPNTSGCHQFILQFSLISKARKNSTMNTRRRLFIIQIAYTVYGKEKIPTIKSNIMCIKITSISSSKKPTVSTWECIFPAYI